MVTPRTGKPRGRPPQNWLQDPDRHVIALADVLEGNFAQPPERALLLAWAILHGEPVQLAANLLRSARRLGLRNQTRRRLEVGWKMASWRAPEIEREQAIERLSKKAKRLANDPTAARWRYSVGAAWLTLLNTREPRAHTVVMAPSTAEKVIIAMMQRAEEESFAHEVMLPLLHAAFPSSPD
jgi:hypothetical protein